MKSLKYEFIDIYALIIFLLEYTKNNWEKSCSYIGIVELSERRIEGKRKWTWISQRKNNESYWKREEE